MSYSGGGKRLFDLTLALLLAAPALIVCLGCILAIRLDSRGAALFCQTRVGRNHRPFTLYKLRTMSVSTGDYASHDVSGQHVTRVGQLLRRLKLDELPQLINVLCGEMSFVGPRPCLPSQSELIAEREKRGVYVLRPGITGPAQVAGIDMSTPVELAEADATYIGRQTLANDLRLLAVTALGGGRGDAVRRV